MSGKEGWVTLCRNPLLGGYPLGIWSLEPRGYDRCQQMPKQVQEFPESPELNPKFINTFVIIELLFFLNLRNEKKKKKKPYCLVPCFKVLRAPHCLQKYKCFRTWNSTYIIFFHKSTDIEGISNSEYLPNEKWAIFSFWGSMNVMRTWQDLLESQQYFAGPGVPTFSSHWWERRSNLKVSAPVTGHW